MTVLPGKRSISDAAKSNKSSVTRPLSKKSPTMSKTSTFFLIATFTTAENPYSILLQRASSRPRGPEENAPKCTSEV